MNILDIVLATISLMLLIEGLFFAVFSDYARKNMTKMFKNKKNLVKAGLIEIILALLVLFIIAL